MPTYLSSQCSAKSNLMGRAITCLSSTARNSTLFSGSQWSLAPASAPTSTSALLQPLALPVQHDTIFRGCRCHRLGCCLGLDSYRPSNGPLVLLE